MIFLLPNKKKIEFEKKYAAIFYKIEVKNIGEKQWNSKLDFKSENYNST